MADLVPGDPGRRQSVSEAEHGFLSSAKLLSAELSKAEAELMPTVAGNHVSVRACSDALERKWPSCTELSAPANPDCRALPVSKLLLKPALVPLIAVCVFIFQQQR